MTIPILASPIALRCKLCNKFRQPHEIYCGDDRSGRICTACYYKYRANMDDLARARPRACFECGITFAELEAQIKFLSKKDSMRPQDLPPDIMYLIQNKDGIVQLLCTACHNKYREKAHEYRGTQYERLAKIR